MALKPIYDSIDEIPEPHRELYTDKGGKFEFTGVEGFKTQADIDRINAALKAEREAHKATKGKLGVWGDLQFDEVRQKLDTIPELEARAGQVDETKIEQLVTARVQRERAPIERDLVTARTELASLTEKVAAYQANERRRTIHESVREAALGKAKIRPEALEDALMLAERIFDVNEDGTVTAKDNVGVTPGISAEIWFSEMQPKRPHWWPDSQGGGGKGTPNGGGGGGFSKNPWSAEHWNITEQMRAMNADPKRAEQMAASAGVSVNAAAPRKKV